MEYKITNHTFPMVSVKMQPGEKITAQSNSFIYANKKVGIDGNMSGGFFKSLGRKVLSGESFFLQEITGQNVDTEVELAAQTLGEIKELQLNASRKVYFMDGAYLAHLGDVNYSSKLQKTLGRSLFTNGGFYIIELEGTGTVIFNSFGSIITKEISHGENYIIDNAHILGWEEGVNYTLEKAGSSWWSSIKSGESLVGNFSGQGKIWIQTHNLQSTADAIYPYIKAKMGPSGSQFGFGNNE